MSEKSTNTLLALDIGNTNVVMGIFTHDTLATVRRLSTRSTRTADEAGIMIKMLCQDAGIDPKAIDAVAIASVAPKIGQVYRAMSEDYIGITPLFIHGDIPGFHTSFERPHEIGADRVCDSIAAFQKYGGPLIVLDFGTAITLEAVNEEGVYLGGSIMPGLQTSAEMLKTATALLPEARLVVPDNVIATSTDYAIRAGLLYGSIHGLRGLIAQMRKEMGAPQAKVIATGGQASIVASHIAEIHAIEPNLVLEGIRIIHGWSKSW